MCNVNSGQGTVQSDETLFAILEALHESEGAGVTELANRLDMAKSAVHKHLKTLERHEYVVRRDGEYHIGLKFLTLGGHARVRNPLCRVTLSKLERIADELDVVAIASVKEYDRGICIGVRNGLTVDVRVHTGTEFRLHRNAAGKAMLARLPDREVRSIAERTGLSKSTDRTIGSSDELLDELGTVRDQGYAINLEESSDGVAGIAVAIEHLPTDTIESVAIACPVSNLTRDDRKDQYVERLFQVRDEIQYQLGADSN